MLKKCMLAAVCCLPLWLFAQKGFTVKGKVGDLGAPVKAVLIYVNDGKRIIDSAVLSHGRFNFAGRVNDPNNAFIFLLRDTATKYLVTVVGKEQARMDVEHFNFYLENANITITSKDSMQHAMVKGSATDADYRTAQALQKPYDDILDSLNTVYRAQAPEKRKDSAWLKTLEPAALRYSQGKQRIKREFIASHPNSYLALLLFQEMELYYNFNPDTADARFARFPKSQRESATGKKLKAMIDNARSTSVGKTATDFTEGDSTGKMISLSDFRGQYVLLDFWASWCGPCRAENPNYLKAYNKFKDKNFTILGVSLDDAKARNAWLKAVKDDNLPWTQISDLKGFQSKSATLYSVRAIPTNFLIDPSGKIIGKNLRGEALQKKLDQLFPM